MVPALEGVLIAAFVLTLLLNTRRPTNIRLRIDGDQFIVELRGWDAIYSCRRRIVTPITNVEGIGVYKRAAIPSSRFRLPGTSVPGRMRAGSYGMGAERDFWDVRKGEDVLVIALKPGSEYRRIVVEVPEPRTEMLRLRPVLGALDWSPTIAGGFASAT